MKTLAGVLVAAGLLAACTRTVYVQQPTSTTQHHVAVTVGQVVCRDAHNPFYEKLVPQYLCP